MHDLEARVILYELAAIASTRGERRRKYARSALVAMPAGALWLAVQALGGLCAELPCRSVEGDAQLFGVLVSAALGRGRR